MKGATIALAGERLGERNVEVWFLGGCIGSLTSSGPVDMESPDSKLGDTLVGLSGSSGVSSSLSFGLNTEIEFPMSSAGESCSSGDTGVFPLTWSSMEPVPRLFKLNLLSFIESRERDRGLISSVLTFWIWLDWFCSSLIFSYVPLRISLPGGGAGASFSSDCIFPFDNQTLLSLGLYFLALFSASDFCFESSTLFHKLAILLVTFFFGGAFFAGSRGLVVLLGLATGFGVLLYIGLVGLPEFRYDLRLSMSELEGTRLGALSDDERKE